MMKKKRKGIAIIYVAISMTVLLIFAALVIDIGILALNKNRVQNACDAAALAGARELPDITKAESIAKEYAAANGVDSNYISVNFPESKDKITVTANNRPSDFFFARIMGINQGFASAHATAEIAPLSGVNGLVPFAVVKDAFTFGQTVVLKQDAGDGISGNYQAVDLDGLSGADVYRNTIINGCETTYMPNQTYTIPTETGNMAGPTKLGIETRIGSDTCTFETYKDDPDCPRIVMVPLIDTLGVNGKNQVTIVGFASFFIENLSGGGGKLQVTGKFIQTVGNGDADSSQKDYGAKGVRLTE